MLFFHVLLLFILGTFAIAAPVGPVWLLGSPQQEGRSSCIGKTICALLGWHAPNLPEPPEEEIWRERDALTEVRFDIHVWFERQVCKRRGRNTDFDVARAVPR